MKKEEKVKFVKKSFSMPDKVYEKLLKLAKKEKRAASNMLTIIIEER